MCRYSFVPLSRNQDFTDCLVRSDDGRVHWRCARQKSGEYYTWAYRIDHLVGSKRLYEGQRLRGACAETQKNGQRSMAHPRTLLLAPRGCRHERETIGGFTSAP